MKKGEFLPRTERERVLAGRLTWVGDDLAADFVNTGYSKAGEVAGALGDWLDLVGFLVRAEALTDAEVREVERELTAAPAGAAAWFDRALGLREAIREIFVALAAGNGVSADAVARVNACLRTGGGHDELTLPGSAQGGWRLERRSTNGVPALVLARLARAAAELVVLGASSRVRRCANPVCPLFFRDRSRTGQRRWCAMAVCGNRAKVTAFARRRRT